MERIVLNPSTVAQNVVNREELSKAIKMTIPQLVEQLLEVSGPYSRNDFILKNVGTLTSGMNTDVIGGKFSSRQEFTRDGIKTLQQIEYTSPIQRYLKDEVLAWIGERVDAMCHDGTTTSMIFAASFLMYLMDSAQSLRLRSIVEIEEAYNEVTEDILKQLEVFKITVDTFHSELNRAFKAENRTVTKEQVRELIARMQAETSSSGRLDVVSAVATVVAHSPVSDKPLTLNYRVPHNETKETGITAVMDDYEYIIPATPLSPHLFTHDRGRKYHKKYADVFVTNTSFIRNKLVAIGVENWLNNHKERYAAPEGSQETPRDFILFFPSSGESDLQYIHEICVRQWTENRINVVVQAYQRPIGYKAPSDDWYYLEAMLGKANVPIVKEHLLGDETTGYVDIDEYIIKDAEILIDYHNAYLSNLVPLSSLPEGFKEECVSRNTHPGEITPELFKWYTDCKTHLEEALESLLADTRNDYQSAIVDIRRGLSAMSTIRAWYVDIKGKLHDVEMYKSIIEDSVGASMIAINDGVFFNGPIKLFKATSNLLMAGKYAADITKNTILLSILCASRDMVYAMFGSLMKRIVNPLQSLIEPACVPYGYINLVKGTTYNPQIPMEPFGYLSKDESPQKDLLVAYGRSPNNPAEPDLITYVRSVFWPETLPEGAEAITPPCQVGNLFEVLFNRLREVTLRLSFTDNIIAPGTVWDDGTIAGEKKK